MSDRPPLLSDEKIIAALVKALKVVAEEQAELDSIWCEDKINQTVKEDLEYSQGQVETSRKELTEQVFKEIEGCTVKDSPFPGFLVLKADKYKEVKEKFE